MLIPRKPTPRMIPMYVRVVAAFFDSGLRKAGTPFEIASTPDRTTAPDENARSRTNSDAEAARVSRRTPRPAPARTRSDRGRTRRPL